MESFRVRHSEPGHERTILLPLSLGVSSLSLLQVLSSHRMVQIDRTGRTGFNLRVLYVDTSGVARDAADTSVLDGVRQRFPEHDYHVADLSSVFDEEDVAGLLNEVGGNGNDLAISSQSTNLDKLQNLLASLPSATSRSDMLQILQRKLIVHHGRQNACEAILFGDTTTRLAEKTLAETAKGRGFALAWHISDGETPHGIPFYYPMRELLRKELIAHAKMVEPPLDPLIAEDEFKPAVSTKNTTIDDLMKQYFESVEQNFPSIVANVVRTTGKLSASTVQGTERRCGLCDLPMEDRSKPLCFGCARTMPAGSI